MADHTNKEVVIAMRNALKAGTNWPIKVYADNTFIIVNEANTASFTKWDDEMGVLYYFRLADPISSKQTHDNPKVISVAAVKYEFIQAMEVVPFPLSKVDDIMDSIESSSGGVTTFADNFRERIKHVFDAILDPKGAENYPALINAIHGATDAVPMANDYYAGRNNVPFKETIDVRRYNEEVKKTKEFEANKQNS